MRISFSEERKRRMTDPYKVLGVTRNASDDEIKKAYRALARKYHPDNYTDSGLADLAEEKMKEINEAYDQIQSERSGKGSSSGSSSYNYGAGTSGDARFAEIRSFINQRRYSEAEIRLDSMSMTDRNAEWNFLKACVLVQRGHFFDAQKYIETACYMDPNNAEYQNVKAQMNSRAGGFGRGYNTGYNTTNPSDCDICTICQTIYCLDCCCECMGGDCIRCC